MAEKNIEMASAESGSENAWHQRIKKKQNIEKWRKIEKWAYGKIWRISGSENGGHRESNKRRRGGGMAKAAKAAKITALIEKKRKIINENRKMKNVKA
jgi:hypothetical protein